MRKFAIVAASAALGMVFTVSVPRAHAAKKVDCDAVMSEVNAGKKTKEVATDLKISAYSVRKCKKAASAKSSPSAAASTAAASSSSPASGASASSPAAAASPAAK